MGNKYNEDTKIYKVLEHLKKYGYITSWDAIMKYGATRLSAIIYILRNDGYSISSIYKSNGKTNYVEYHLGKW